MVKYVYDAWGNHKVCSSTGAEISDTTHVGHINPIRYRGYYYDTETKLYFLNSRYYDPQVGRFISPDNVNYLNPESINGLNLYCYCMNNPIMYADPSGHVAISIGLLLAIGGIVGAAIDVLTKAVTGFYRTPGIASNALRLSGQNLVKQWNKMVVSQAGKALTKALAYGGTALLIGTAGKGWLYDWYNDYF